ncbi:MAG: TMEM165/GDT1 family protein [Spirulina sp. DLM2.Bin59]|nr:MAG: TMEM165/GDT1 family protein [Spirulina sp. DLM2.Bin59]
MRCLNWVRLPPCKSQRKVRYTSLEFSPPKPVTVSEPLPNNPDGVDSSSIDTPKRGKSFWATCTSTFLTILLAEMGDKTQLATLLITAESHRPWIVFAGAATALIATSLIGVALGWWLARRVSPKVMDLAAAAMLMTVAVLLLWDIVGM